MISTAYVNGIQDLALAEMSEDSLTNSTNAIIRAIESAIYDYHSAVDMLFVEKDIMGELDDEKELVIEAEQKSLVTKVGEHVVKLFEQIQQAIQTIIDKFREMITGKKDNTIDKIEYLSKKHPELQEEIKKYFMEHQLELKDVKTIAELDKQVDEIIKMGQKADPKSLKGKIERAKEKLADIDKSAPIKVVGAVTALYVLKKHILDNSKYAQEKKQQNAATHQKLKQMGMINDTTGVFTSLLKVHQINNLKFTKALNENQTKLDKMVSDLAGIADRVVGKKSTSNYHKNQEHVDKHFKDKEEKEMEKKAKQSGMDKAAQLAAQRKDAKEHEVEDLAREKRKAEVLQKARDKAGLQFKKDHQQELNDLEVKKQDRLGKARSKQALKDQTAQAENQLKIDQQQAKARRKIKKKDRKAMNNVDLKHFKKKSDDYLDKAYHTSYAQLDAKRQFDADQQNAKNNNQSS